jgi:glycosyltransferase involved in cell wall biosynthesis
MYLTHIIANSLETKKTILQNNPRLFPPEKIKVIYNGIDPDSFSGQRGDRPFDPPPGKIILGNAGRLVHQKGHDMLLDLANIMAAKGMSFHLYVAGDGPLMDHLLKRRNDLGLEKHVSFLGHVENIHAFMSSLDIFLLTSRWEGFGYVLLEAMACSRPVVCFNVSSNPELIMDGVNGFLVEYDDLSSFAERIAQLAGDPELRLSMGNSGHEILRTRFTHDRSIGELEKFMAE